MKNITTLLLGVILLLPFSHTAVAQEKAKTKIAHVKHKGDLVLFTLSSSKPFIFGSNKYYLHVGEKEFTRNEQTKSKGKGSMTFFIPSNEFNELHEGTAIYLTYGRPSGDEGIEQLSQDKDVPCWSLGKFSKSLLSK